MKKKKKSYRELIFLGLILILVIVLIYSGFQILESTVFRNQGAGTVSSQSKTITRDGIDYFPRQDITIVMVLGIDQMGPVRDSGSYNNEGASDVVALMIFDEETEECRILCLNRDTMLEMPILGIGGKQAGTRFGQLALAHTYGSGLEDSCENVRKAVSDFLYGIKIDYYVSLNMDAITILNDAVGGVTVNVRDDFSKIDPSIPMGEVTLRGEQALRFVQTRKGMGDQMNLSRMDRHEEYMNGFMEALKKKLEGNSAFATDVYEKVADYVVTDCSVAALSSMISRYLEHEVAEIVSPEGETVQNQYVEFHAEEEALDKLILRLFYAPKE